jgi:tetratricopeptide (TPR) repeat protein
MPREFHDRWEALSPHLDRALDLPEAERTSWLAELALTDPDMAELVARALQSRERAGFELFLEKPPPHPLLPAAHGTLAGRRVGSYVIDTEIGRGGMGSVWRAHRVDGRYEGTVAIKFVHASWIGRAAERRFEVEGNLLGRLDHPNIARLIDAGLLDAAQPYLVLEYVEGEPIDAYCDRQQLGLEARIELFSSVLAAVAHAHSHLIVHRDVKPSNIFVTRDGVVKLLDFGIAKLLRDGTDGAAPTQSSAAGLTPRYAAPEQLLGNPVTTATDVYSLGLVLYLLLTGKHPVAAESASSAELLQWVLQQEPERASLAATVPTIRRRALAGDLDNILGKALKKAPAERYPSIGAFADDLRRFLVHEPVQARADTVTYRVGKFVKRHRGGVLSALLVTMALIGTTAFALWELSEARADRDIAVSEERRAHGREVMMGFLFNDSVRQSPEDAVHKRLDRAREFISRQYRGDPDIAASLLLDLRTQYLDIGDAKTASALRQSAEAIARHFNDPYMNADIACRAALDMAVAGDLPAARAQIQAALASMQLLRVISPALKLNCAEPAQRLAMAEGDYATAIANGRILLSDIEERGEFGSNAWITASYELATALGQSGDFRGAYSSDSHILEVIKEQGLKDTAYYYSLSALGCAALRAGGQPRKSIDFVGSVIADARSGGADIDVPYYLEVCRDLSRLQAGEVGDVEESLLRNAAAASTSGLQNIAVPHQTALVSAAIRRHDLATAEKRWAPLAPIEQQMIDAKRSGVEITGLLLAHARLDLLRGDGADALRRVDQVAGLIAARHQTNTSDRSVEILRAEVLWATGNYADAAKHAQIALDMARKTAIDPSSSSFIGEALFWRARAEAALGDGARARATAREALPHLQTNMDPGSELIAGARALLAT